MIQNYYLLRFLCLRRVCVSIFNNFQLAANSFLMKKSLDHFQFCTRHFSRRSRTRISFLFFLQLHNCFDFYKWSDVTAHYGTLIMQPQRCCMISTITAPIIKNFILEGQSRRILRFQQSFVLRDLKILRDGPSNTKFFNP